MPGFVAELFRGRIARIPAGSDTREHWRNVILPADVEWTPGGLWATTRVLTDSGRVAVYPLD